MRIAQKAFSIVELAVVIAVIGILATITTVGYTKLQKDARDTERASDIAVVQSALETHYEKHGQYPDSGGGHFNENFFRNTLNIPSAALVSPTAPAGATFSFTGVTATNPSQYGYYPEASPGVGCGSGSSCIRYRLTWVQETDNATQTVNSRYGW